MSALRTLAQQNTLGAVLMCAAMLGFAIEDAFIKKLAQNNMTTPQIVFYLSLGGAALFVALLRKQGKPVFSRALLTGPIILRNIGEVVGTLFFMTAIAYTPLSSASAILQASPLLVTLGAALFFGEAVGWRRWSAILVGLFGVMLIVRPGLESFDPMSLFAVVGVIGLSVRDLATRKASSQVDSVQLSAIAFILLIPAGALLNTLLGEWTMPSALDSVYIIVTVVLGVTAYYALTSAMRLGEISMISPFRYSRLVFALVIGVVVFAERPDSLTLLGAGIIICAGLYTFLRERRLAKRRLRENAAK